MANEREYFKTAKEAVAKLAQNKMFVTETNSSFNYCNELCTCDAGIRSDVIGYWIEYRHYA